MPDYHQIVDQIRGIVQSSDQTRSERLEQLAVEYATACGEVNQRLGRCQWLLQQGLRSEAIQLAETEPKLLGAIASLDFPERPDWDELTGVYGLAAAPKLLVEAAGFLNAAYAEEEPLQDLLVKHRRLAMQRSPLRIRIGAMRQLAAQDPNNLVGATTFVLSRRPGSGRSRSRPLRPSGCMTPLTSVGCWRRSSSRNGSSRRPGLVQGLTKADAQLRGQQTRASLADVDGRLNDAFAARDAIRGRIVRNEWIALTAAAPLDPGDAIWERIRPALSWLDEEDRHDAADQEHEEVLGALVKALDRPGFIRPSELERLGQAVLSHGRGMPEALQQRFLVRLKDAEMTHSRRFRLIASGAAAAVMLGVVLAFTLFRGYLRAGEASQVAVSITDLIELGELDRAAEFIKTVEKADSGLLAYPPMIDARQKFDAAQAKETERETRFDKAMREAERPRSRSPSRRVSRMPGCWPVARPRSRPLPDSSNNVGPRSSPSARDRRRASGRGSKRSIKGSMKSAGVSGHPRLMRTRSTSRSRGYRARSGT